MACLRRFFCCISLRVGGIVSGILSLVLAIRVLVSLVVTYLAAMHLVERFSDARDNRGNSTLSDRVEGSAESLDTFRDNGNQTLRTERSTWEDENNDRRAGQTSIIHTASITVLAMVALFAVTSVLLIYGAAKGRRGFMLPWIICAFVFLLGYLGGMCLSVWLVGLGHFWVIITLVETCFGFYLWLCVVSLFQVGKIRGENKEETVPGVKNYGKCSDLFRK